jgi:hypothetical protein
MNLFNQRSLASKRRFCCRLYLVNEDNARDDLGYTLVNISFNDLVHFTAQLIRYFGPTRVNEEPITLMIS